MADESQRTGSPVDLKFTIPPRMSLRMADVPILPRRLRIGLGATIAALHVLVLLWFALDREEDVDGSDERIEVVFVPVTQSARPPPPMPRAHRVRSAVAAPASAPRVAPASSARAQAQADVPPTLRLLNADGSIAIPQAVLDDLDGVLDAKRTFSHRMPGLYEARGFFDRRPELDYVPTRFDKVWRKDTDLLTEKLAEVVEKTTTTIRIPLPRSHTSAIVCKVAWLSLGGSCGMVNNGEFHLGVLDDPHTLDSEEDAQCRAWWAEIVQASTPEQWRTAIDRYEKACRKPLAVPQVPP